MNASNQSPPSETLCATPSAEPPRRPNNITERIGGLRDALLTGLVERDVPIRLALLAALSGEHLLMIGPPGTAKSLIARRLRQAFAGATYFERLLTRFTVPEELFGPLSIRGLEQDRYERLTAGYLPTASFAFLDEIFKANSAILNALLTLINERKFDNGALRVQTPLLSVVGASNELPEDGLEALYDRFLLRLHVGPVSPDGFLCLMRLSDCECVVPEALKLTTGDVLWVQEQASRVELPDDVLDLLSELRRWCISEDIAVSDRRWRQVKKLLQVAALTNERPKVSTWDCWLLQHCLWEKPEDREKIYHWYIERVGAGSVQTPAHLTRVVTGLEVRLKIDQAGRTQRQDKMGRLLYRKPDGSTTTKRAVEYPTERDGNRLYRLPEEFLSHRSTDRTNGGRGYTEEELDQQRMDYQSFRNWDKRSSYLRAKKNRLTEKRQTEPVMDQTRWSTGYIQQRLTEVGDIAEDVRAYKETLVEHIASLQDEIGADLYITADFIEPASASLNHRLRDVDTLLGRVEALRKGFDALPVDDGLAVCAGNSAENDLVGCG